MDGAVDVLGPIEKEDKILLPVKTPVLQSKSLVALLCLGFIGPQAQLINQQIFIIGYKEDQISADGITHTILFPHWSV